jgi:hypothetical protein
LSEQKDRQADNMRELHEKLEQKAKDLTTVRGLLAQLDLDGGTAEGANEIEQAVDRTENVTEEVFDQDDTELEREHSEGTSFQSELTERKETSEGNLGRITDATAPLETRETIDQIREGKEAALRDVDFLQDLVQRAMESLKESEDIQQDLRGIRTSGG